MIESILEAERLLAVGLLDQAELRFAQVLEADPRNSIAAVGLARVAVERGDNAAALELARRAASIDPENPAATGMIVRLEEVLGAPEPMPPSSEPTPPAPEPPPPASEPTSTTAPSPRAASSPRRRRRGLLGRILRRR